MRLKEFKDNGEGYRGLSKITNITILVIVLLLAAGGILWWIDDYILRT